MVYVAIKNFKIVMQWDGPERIDKNSGITLPNLNVSCLCSQRVQMLALQECVHVSENEPFSIDSYDHLFENSMIQTGSMFVLEARFCVNHISEQGLNVLFKLAPSISERPNRGSLLRLGYHLLRRF